MDSSSPPPSSSTHKRQRENFVVCTTGLSVPDRQLALQLSKELEGSYHHGDVDETVTHLVAKRVGSSKYKAAVMRSIPIVHPSFLLACTKVHKLLDLAPFLLGCFAGLTICTTGFTSPHTELATLVQANGGQFETTLDMDKTTHLVVKVHQQPTVSAKHKAALEWNIKIVSMAWIHACVESGAWLPEAEYPPPLLPSPPATVVPTHDPSSSSQHGMMENETTEDEEMRVWTRVRNQSPLILFRRLFFFIDCVESNMERWKTLRSLVLFCGGLVLYEYSPVNTTHYVLTSPTHRLPANARSLHFIVTGDFICRCAEQNVRLKELEFRPSSCVPLMGKIVCVSQYTGAERAEVERLCVELGGTYTERLTRINPRVDFLICKGTFPENEKTMRAQEWGVKIHDLEWLRQKHTST